MDRLDFGRIGRHILVVGQFGLPPRERHVPRGQAAPKAVERLDLDAQLFARLALEGFRLRFTRLDTSARKANCQRRNRPALSGESPAAAPDAARPQPRRGELGPAGRWA